MARETGRDAQRAKDGRAFEGTKTAGNLLAQFPHPQIVFRLSVRQRNRKVGQEMHDQILMLLQAEHKGETIAFLESPTLACLLRRRGIGSQSDVHHVPTATSSVLLVVVREVVHPVAARVFPRQMHGAEPPCHLRGPGVLKLLMGNGQCSQSVGNTESMRAGRGQRHGPALMYTCPLRVRHDLHRLECLVPPCGMRQRQRVPLRARHMHPPPWFEKPKAGFIVVSDPTVLHDRFDLLQHWSHALGTLLASVKNHRLRKGRGEPIGEQRADSCDRQQWEDAQVHREGFHLRTLWHTR